MTRLKHNESITDLESGYSQLRQKKWGCQSLYYVLITFLLLVLATLKINDFGYASSAHQTTTNPNVCDTEDCISSAKYLAGSINKFIDPCEDFYQFACGNFQTNNGIPKKSQVNNVFLTMEHTIQKHIRDVMEKDSGNTEPNSITKLRQLYRSCTATDRMDAIGLDPLLELLNKIGLPLKTGSDIWLVIAQINRYTNLEYLFSLFVETNLNSTTYSRIALSHPTSESFLLLPHKRTESITKINSKKIKNVFPSVSQLSKTTEEYFIAVWEAIYKLQPNNPRVSSDELKERFVLVKSVENKLEEIKTKLSTSQPYPTLISVNDLQLLTNNWTESTSYMAIFDWRKYITLQFADIKNVTVNFETDFIQVENVRYLLEVFKMLTTFPVNTVGEHVLWQVISTFLPYTTNQMRSLQYTFLPDTDRYSSRSIYCAHVINDMMGLAVANVLNDSELIKHNRLMMKEMMKNIHESFEKIVNELKWMDDASKNKTLYKARKMKEIVGFPDFIMDPDRLDSYYSDFEVIEDDFFGNIIRYTQRELRTELAMLREKPRNRTDKWIFKPYEVNAFNEIIANIIVVPVGILQFPIFGHNLQVLNYGSLGTILGHELTHGFDNSGRLFDADGHLNMWWTNQTAVNFSNLTDCFIRQYETFSIPGTQEKVNGVLTLDENIADNGGLREAFWAYRKFVAENGEGKKLPGLEDFSEEQIFFLAFANNWCEAATNDVFLGFSKDSHSPKNVRATAVVMNSDEFSQVWKCEKGTKMNPDKEKCRIW